MQTPMSIIQAYAHVYARSLLCIVQVRAAHLARDIWAYDNPILFVDVAAEPWRVLYCNAAVTKATGWNPLHGP